MPPQILSFLQNLLPFMRQQAAAPNPGAGFVTPGTQQTPNATTIQRALAANPLLAALAQDFPVAGVSQAQAPAKGGMSDMGPTLAALGPIAKQLMGEGGGSGGP